ncbi:MAG: Zn-dependent alcohol dehydrogenase [Pseudomonadota bacterium]
MKAALCRAFGAPLSVEEVTLAPPGPGEVAVRIAACAICHSDIAYADGAWGGDLPMVLGHEASGYVTAAGAGVDGLSVGQPVLVTLIRHCGTCPACAGGAPTSCAQAFDAAPSPIRDARGAAVAQGMATGAFAEAVVVDRSQVVAIPHDMDMAVAACLACGVLTGVGAVRNTAALAPGQNCAVIGAGGVGLNAIQGARLAKAGLILAVDLSQDRLRLAREFGATHGLHGDDPDLSETVRDLSAGGVDYVFVTVGAPAVFQSAPALLAPGGAVVLVGLPPAGVEVPYAPTTLAALNQRILGSRMGQSLPVRDIPWLIDRYRAKELLLDELVTGRYPLDRINAAIADARAGRSLRNVIVLGDTAAGLDRAAAAATVRA